MSDSAPVPAHDSADGVLVGAMTHDEATEINKAVTKAAAFDRVWGAHYAGARLLGLALFVAQSPYAEASNRATDLLRELSTEATNHYASREVPQ